MNLTKGIVDYRFLIAKQPMPAFGFSFNNQHSTINNQNFPRTGASGA